MRRIGQPNTSNLASTSSEAEPKPQEPQQAETRDQLEPNGNTRAPGEGERFVGHGQLRLPVQKSRQGASQTLPSIHEQNDVWREEEEDLALPVHPWMKQEDHEDLAAALNTVPLDERADVAKQARHFLGNDFKLYDTWRCSVVIYGLAQLPRHERQQLVQLAHDLAVDQNDSFFPWPVAEVLRSAPADDRASIARHVRGLVQASTSPELLDVVSLLRTMKKLPADERMVVCQMALPYVPQIFSDQDQLYNVLDALVALPASERASVGRHAGALINDRTSPEACGDVMRELGKTPESERASVVQLAQPFFKHARTGAGSGSPASDLDFEQCLLHALRTLPAVHRKTFVEDCEGLLAQHALSVDNMEYVYAEVKHLPVPVEMPKPWEQLAPAKLQQTHLDGTCCITFLDYADLEKPVTLADDPRFLADYDALMKWWARSDGKRPDRSRDAQETMDPNKLQQLPVGATAKDLEKGA